MTVSVQSLKLCQLRSTVYLCQVNSFMQTILQGSLKYPWRRIFWISRLTDRKSVVQRIFLQDMDYCKNVHTCVRKLICLVLLIPEDNLTYKIIPCNSIIASFLDYIHIYSVMVFSRHISFFEIYGPWKSDMVDTFLNRFQLQ